VNYSSSKGSFPQVGDAAASPGTHFTLASCAVGLCELRPCRFDLSVCVRWLFFSPEILPGKELKKGKTRKFVRVSHFRTVLHAACVSLIYDNNKIMMIITISIILMIK
jgi:hypothetical protein